MTEGLDQSTKAALNEHRRSWKETSLSCQSLDVAMVQEGVALTYLLAGLPPPDRLIWLESPFAGAVAASILDRFFENVHLKVFHKPIEKMQQKLFSDENGDKQFWTTVDEAIKRSPLGIEQMLVTPVRTQIGAQMEARFAGREHDRQVFSEEVWGYIFARLEQQLSDSEFNVLSKSKFDAQFAISATNTTWYCGLGQHDGDSLEFLSFAESAGMDLPTIRGILKMARHCGWWWAYDKVCIVTFRPLSILLDGEDRIHNDVGPAIEYADGWSVLARHGNFVPSRVIDFGFRKNLLEIEKEPNVEIRRHMIELYGIEEYLKDAEAVRIHQDECGSLYRRDFIGGEPLMMVKVLNSTPEPDGTRKWYYLRVPPNMTTAREAVAWTFGLEEAEYFPEIET